MATVVSDHYPIGTYTYGYVSVDYSGTSATAYLHYVRTNNWSGEEHDTTNWSFTFGGVTTYSHDKTSVSGKADNVVAHVGFPISLNGGTYSGSSSSSVFRFSGSVTIPAQVTAPSYSSISAGSITSNSVVLSATINNGGASITSGGWQLSTNGGTNWTTYSGDWTSKTITGLTRATTYTYRGYATNSVGTTYSSTSTFTTLAEKPSYTAISSSNVTATSVTLSATINNGGATITAGGWQLSTDGGSTWTTYSGDWASKSITNIQRNTTYTYRGYATNSAGTTYSSTGTFTTLIAIPTVSAPTVSDITYNSLSASFTITDNGGGTITNSYMNIYDRALDELVTVIQGTSGTATGLSPETVYIVESHAVNSAGQGISYVQVTTPAAPVSKVKVSLNGGAFSTTKVKLSLNGQTFVDVSDKINVSVNGN